MKSAKEEKLPCSIKPSKRGGNKNQTIGLAAKSCELRKPSLPPYSESPFPKEFQKWRHTHFLRDTGLIDTSFNHVIEIIKLYRHDFSISDLTLCCLCIGLDRDKALNEAVRYVGEGLESGLLKEKPQDGLQPRKFYHANI